LQKDSNGKTPIDLARDNRQEGVVECLEQQAEKLGFAMPKGKEVELQELEAKKAFVLQDLEAKVFAQYTDYTKENIGTALHLAAIKGDEKFVRGLLEAGADMEATDRSNYTPLHIAAFYGKKQVLEDLLDAGANINTPNSWGETPLHDAVSRGETEIAEELLKRGADKNAQGYDKATPLHIAAKNGIEGSVKLLLAAGVDQALTDEDGKTAWDLAINDEITVLFEKKDEDRAKEITSKARYTGKSLENLKKLVAGNKFEELAKMPYETLNMFEIPDDVRRKISYTKKEAHFQEHWAKKNSGAKLPKGITPAKLADLVEDREYDALAKIPAAALKRFPIEPDIILRVNQKRRITKDFDQEWKKHTPTKGAGQTDAGGSRIRPLASNSQNSIIQYNIQLEALANKDLAIQIVPENLTTPERKEWGKIEKNSVSLDRELEAARQEADNATRLKKRGANKQVKTLEGQAKEHTKEVTEYARQLLEQSDNLPAGKKKVERLDGCFVSTDKTQRKVTLITRDEAGAPGGAEVNENFKGKKVFMWRYDESHEKIKSQGTGSKSGFEVDWIEFDKEGQVIGGFVGPPPEHASLEDNLIKEIHGANKEQRKLVASIKLAKDIGGGIAEQVANAPGADDDAKGRPVSTHDEPPPPPQYGNLNLTEDTPEDLEQKARALIQGTTGQDSLTDPTLNLRGHMYTAELAEVLQSKENIRPAAETLAAVKLLRSAAVSNPNPPRGKENSPPRKRSSSMTSGKNKDSTI
jgi:hypothetical protein